MTRRMDPEVFLIDPKTRRLVPLPKYTPPPTDRDLLGTLAVCGLWIVLVVLGAVLGLTL